MRLIESVETFLEGANKRTAPARRRAWMIAAAFIVVALAASYVFQDRVPTLVVQVIGVMAAMIWVVVFAPSRLELWKMADHWHAGDELLGHLARDVSIPECTKQSIAAHLKAHGFVDFGYLRRLDRGLELSFRADLPGHKSILQFHASAAEAAQPRQGEALPRCGGRVLRLRQALDRQVQRSVRADQAARTRVRQTRSARRFLSRLSNGVRRPFQPRRLRALLIAPLWRRYDLAIVGGLVAAFW